MNTYPSYLTLLSRYEAIHNNRSIKTQRIVSTVLVDISPVKNAVDMGKYLFKNSRCQKN